MFHFDMPSGWIRKALLILLIPLIGQCGGKKGKSAEVEIEAIPDKPVVINADSTSGDKTYKKPWFKFQVKLTNNSDTKITIVALETETVSTTISGFNTMKGAVDPSTHNKTISINDVVHECNYASYGTIDAKSSGFLQISHQDPECPQGPITFFIDGVTVDDVSPNFRFRVKLKPIGWFGPADEPQDRFENSGSFSTQ